LAIGAISDQERQRQQERVAFFSWQKSAKSLLDHLAPPANIASAA